MSKRPPTSVISWSLFAIIIAALIGLKLGFHEMWKDEWQAWFVSRDMDLISLVKFLYYEGHPALFYLYLKPFAWVLPHGEWGLKLAHLIPVIATYYLIWRMPFPLWFKILVGLSYPLFFEYGVVSRGYTLTILLGVLLCTVKNEKWIYALIFLLCQTEVQGVFLASAFLGLTVLEPNDRKRLPGRALAWLLGLVTFVLTVFPRTDRDELNTAYSASPLEWSSWMTSIQGNVANVFGVGIIPDTNVFGWSFWGILLSLVFLGVMFYFFKKNRKAGKWFGLYLLASLLFHAIIYSGGLRQWMMVFVAFILSAAWWVPITWNNRNFKAIILLLFMGPIWYNVLAIKKDLTMPFSNSQAVGTFIKENVPEEVPIVALNKFECTPVIGYAERPFYALPDGEPFTYFRWVEKVYLPTSSELELFTKFKKVGGIVLLAPGKLDLKRFPKLEEWKVFDQPNLKGENYVLYTRKLVRDD